jgi:2-dehydro-3-deoxyphosphogluconate aldolase / (4S)-4-hydroxy-2-oxoglutarate aldolase
MHPILSKLGTIGLVPVVKIEKAERAVGLAKALIDGGLPCAEVTFRTDAAEESIKAISKAFPEMIVGAGTVINVELAKKAVASGAKFIVSPGFNPAVVDWCIANNVPVVPGINNPSGVEAGLERGLEVLKLFPAEVSGGVNMLDALAGPFSQVSFMPTGGVDLKNLPEYAKRSNVIAIGGTWMVKADLIEKEDWAAITQLCKEAVIALHGFSFAHIGINEKDEKAATEAASLFALFGFIAKPGNSSIFNGDVIEVMKSPFRGTHGHIGLKCWNIERALAYLERFGFHGVEETAKRDKGKLSVIYLDKEIGGFAVHLVKAK